MEDCEGLRSFLDLRSFSGGDSEVDRSHSTPLMVITRSDTQQSEAVLIPAH